MDTQSSDFEFRSALFYTIASLTVIYLIFKLRASLRRRAYFNSLPGPKLHPLWGSLNLFPPNEAGLKNLEKYMSDHRNDKIMRLRVGPFRYFIRLLDPETVGRALSMGMHQLPKSQFISSVLSGFLGWGLLILNYEKWLDRRRMLTPAFHFSIIQSYMSTYNDATDVLLNKWSSQLEEGNGTVDIYRDSTLFTLDVILRCACSYETNCQLGDNENAKEYISAIFDSSELAVKRLRQILNIFWYLSPNGKRWQKVCNRIKQESLKIVQARKAAILSGEKSIKTRPDFIDILLTSSDSSGATLSDSDIMSEMNTFLFEGHDTTASGIAWTLYTLSQHPGIQRKCREEIRAVLGGRQSLECDDLDSLKYTSMCIKESMRLYPPVPFITRLLNEDLPVDGYVIPKGTALNIPILLLHHNPKYWENPEVFDPLRFSVENPGGSNFSYVPFSAGHRNCIGQKFAQTEELISVARVLNRFQLEAVTKDSKRLSQLILKPEGRLEVKLSFAQ